MIGRPCSLTVLAGAGLPSIAGLAPCSTNHVVQGLGIDVPASAVEPYSVNVIAQQRQCLFAGELMRKPLGSPAIGRYRPLNSTTARSFSIRSLSIRCCISDAAAPIKTITDRADNPSRKVSLVQSRRRLKILIKLILMVLIVQLVPCVLDPDRFP